MPEHVSCADWNKIVVDEEQEKAWCDEVFSIQQRRTRAGLSGEKQKRAISECPAIALQHKQYVYRDRFY